MSCYFLESTAFAKLFVQEPGTDALIRLMEAVEDNRKLIAACAPLEVYAAIRKRERAGDISPEKMLQPHLKYCALKPPVWFRSR